MMTTEELNDKPTGRNERTNPMTDMLYRADAIAALKAAKLPFGYGQAVYAITKVPAAQVWKDRAEAAEAQVEDCLTHSTSSIST